MRRFLLPAKQIKPIATLIMIGALGIGISLAIFFQSRDYEQNRRRQNFERFAYAQTEAINNQLALSVSLVKSVRGFMDVAKPMNCNEFAKYVRSLNLDQNVQEIRWVPRVRHADMQSYLAMARMHVHDDFQIFERTQTGAKIKAMRRQQYFPVSMVEPMPEDRTRLGFDLGTDAVAMKALTSAADMGLMVSTGRLPLAKRMGPQYGLQIFAPVYRTGEPLASVEERRRALIGFVSNALRVGDMVGTALNLRTIHSPDVLIYIVDDNAPAETALLYPKGAENALKATVDSPLRLARKIEVADRTWSILVVPQAGSRFTANYAQSFVILATALMATGLVVLLLLSAFRRSAYAHRLVEKRTAELEEMNASLADAKAQLSEMVVRDPLTGIANRKLFQEQLRLSIAKATRIGEPVAVLMIDLDGFKSINDSTGHHAGDAVLLEVARRLEDCVRDADLVARLGGDEFGVLVTAGASSRGVKLLARRMDEVLQKPITAFGREFRVGMSIGISFFPDHACDPDSLIVCADVAMYEAKRRGRLYAISDGEMRIDGRDELCNPAFSPA